MNELAFVIAVLGALHFLVGPKRYRKADATVHIQAKTEDAETVDFAVVLFADETVEQQEAKMRKYFDMTESRRKFNNDRLQEIYCQAQQELEASKKVAPIKG